MTEQVLEFIHRRWPQDCNWTDGNCYWFALILAKRFPEGEIYYLPAVGHFIVKIDGTFFDWTGIAIITETPKKFSDIKKEDELWYNHIIRDCFY